MPTPAVRNSLPPDGSGRFWDPHHRGPKPTTSHPWRAALDNSHVGKGSCRPPWSPCPSCCARRARRPELGRARAVTRAGTRELCSSMASRQERRQQPLPQRSAVRLGEMPRVQATAQSHLRSDPRPRPNTVPVAHPLLTGTPPAPIPSWVHPTAQQQWDPGQVTKETEAQRGV